MDVQKFVHRVRVRKGKECECLRLMVVEAAGAVTRDDCTPRVWRDVIFASVDAGCRWVLHTLEGVDVWWSGVQGC
jgi:hypothetical protein